MNTLRTNTRDQLARELRLRDLVFLVVGTVIGSGIFLVPGVVLRSAGYSVSLSMAAWVLGGALSLLGALTFGELSAMMPKAGGLYVYIRDSFGRLPAFLFGWTLFFVISAGSVAALAAAFSIYLAEFFPLSQVAAKIISVLMIAIIGVVNVLGTRSSANLQNVTTAIKVGALLIMSAALLVFGHLGRSAAATVDHPGNIGSSASLSGFGLAMISVLWAYEGWHYVSYSAGEAIHPQRDFPIAFLLGTLLLITIYVLANFGYLAVLGTAGVANSNRVAATALAKISPIAAKLVASIILISVFSAANSVVLTSSRVYYAMAQDGLFFRRLAEVHPRFHTPAFSVVACSIWSAILAASGTFEQLLTYVVFVGWMFYALAAGTIFVYRIRQPQLERPYRVPAYPLPPVIFILAVACVAVNTIVNQPARALVGLSIVFAGTPAYFIWRRLNKRTSDSETESSPAEDVQNELTAGD